MITFAFEGLRNEKKEPKSKFYPRSGQLARRGKKRRSREEDQRW